MKSSYFLSLFFLCVFAMSCGEKKVDELQQETALYKEIMDMHDEVMPRMSEVERQIKQLNDYKEKWPDGTDSVFLMKMPQFLEPLHEASDEMMTWMNNFKQKESWSDTGTYLQYLVKEKTNMKWVKISIRNSIKESEYLIRLIKGEEEFKGRN